MRLKDFFSFKDLVRTALLGSALFFFIGAAYGVFLHAQYSTQVSDIKGDLLNIADVMEAKSTQAYGANDGQLARDYKDASQRAKELASMVQAPPVSPNAYTYFNYWIASAAFTELYLSPEVLGLPPSTIDVMGNLTKAEVLGEAGWWNRSEFRAFDKGSGEWRDYLEKQPVLQSNFWTFYIFVFLVSVLTVFFATKEEYELPVLPEVLYGIAMPALFFVLYSVSSVLSLSGVVRFLDPSQVDVMVSLIAFVIMVVISAFGALVAAMLRMRFKRIEL
jgi:hypothetical protein